MLGLEVQEHLRASLISDLSSASSGSRFRHACSTAVLYSPVGRYLGVIAKLGPWSGSDSWDFESRALDRFLTHLCVVVQFAVVVVVVLVLVITVSLYLLSPGQPP